MKELVIGIGFILLVVSYYFIRDYEIIFGALAMGMLISLHSEDKKC